MPVDGPSGEGKDMSELDEIRARWKEATPGPWHIRADGAYSDLPSEYNVWALTVHNRENSHRIAARITRYIEEPKIAECCAVSWTGSAQALVNAEAIAHAPTDIDYLLAEIERLNKALHPSCTCEKCTGLRSIESFYEDSELSHIIDAGDH